MTSFLSLRALSVSAPCVRITEHSIPLFALWLLALRFILLGHTARSHDIQSPVRFHASDRTVVRSQNTST